MRGRTHMHDISPITRAIRTGIAEDPNHGAVIPPLYLSTTYTFESFNTKRIHDYSRDTNPTRDILTRALATLEEGVGGVTTSSGMGAITTLLFMLTNSEDHILVPADCYGGTWRLFESLAERGHFTCTTADFTDINAVRAALQAHPTALVWIETPSNPTMRITDIAAVAAAAHEADAVVVADNTFLTPLQQRPLSLGADYVMHSTTKYINGHSDVIGGAIIASTQQGADNLRFWANNLGTAGSAYDSHMIMRGLRSIGPRIAAHRTNAQAVAEALQAHPAVERVYYPGLPDHPGHDLASRQQDGFGAIVSFDLCGGLTAVKAFLDGLQLFTFAESLGGTESLIEHPTTMSHATMTEQARQAAGITEAMLRLAVGIEDIQDLLTDLTMALDRAHRA
ncbi:cystathionine gamma-synthase [Dermatophilus congolensis]|uniref:cystathionine gamma-synthase n=1 Tax=Dermatophilus congolensis TaxID=1863 RepID=UPI001FB88574|nr:cystathionine gamma-synthase [Dermatophilus congolensis]